MALLALCAYVYKRAYTAYIHKHKYTHVYGTAQIVGHISAYSQQWARNCWWPRTRTHAYTAHSVHTEMPTEPNAKCVVKQLHKVYTKYHSMERVACAPSFFPYFLFWFCYNFSVKYHETIPKKSTEMVHSNTCHCCGRRTHCTVQCACIKRF